MGIISAIKGWWNNMFKSELKDKFQVTGITSGAMQDAIQKWMNIYNGEPEWLDPENGIRTINFAGFICEEIARLSTLAIDVNFDGRRAKYMKDFWDTCVKDHIREWTESMPCRQDLMICSMRRQYLQICTIWNRQEIMRHSMTSGISHITKKRIE